MRRTNGQPSTLGSWSTCLSRSVWPQERFVVVWANGNWNANISSPAWSQVLQSRRAWLIGFEISHFPGPPTKRLKDKATGFGAPNRPSKQNLRFILFYIKNTEGEICGARDVPNLAPTIVFMWNGFSFPKKTYLVCSLSLTRCVDVTTNTFI